MASNRMEDREVKVQVNGDAMWDFQDSTPGGVLNGDASEIGALLDRPTSAPPALEVSRDPFFAAPGSAGFLDISDQLRFGIGDVRLIPNYEKYYEQHRDATLPPPLERSPFVTSPLFADNSPQQRSSYSPGLSPYSNQPQQPNGMASLSPAQAQQRRPQQAPMSPQMQMPNQVPNGYYGPQVPPMQRHSLPVATPGMPYAQMPPMSPMNPMNPMEAQKYLAMMNSFGGMYISPGSGMPGSVMPQIPPMGMLPPNMEQLQQHQQQMMRAQAAQQQAQAVSPQAQQPPAQMSAPQSTPHPHIQTLGRKNGIPQSASPKTKRRNTRDAVENQQIWAGSPPGSSNAVTASAPKNVIPRNKNIGKVAINSDSNLSSSTEDLLALAGKTHLRAFNNSPSPSGTPRSASLNNSNPNLPAGGESSEDVSAFYSPAQTSSPAKSSFGSNTMTELPAMIFPPVPAMFDGASALSSYAPPSAQLLPVVHPSGAGLPNVAGHSAPPTPAAAIVVPSALSSAGPTSPSAGAPPRLNLHMSPNGSPATQVCRYYAQGYCSRGEKCTFLHTDAPTVEAEKPTDGGKRSPRPISSPTRYLNMALSECVGQIFSMCKDQHGCRFLQRKLDEDGAPAVTAIFTEVIEHIVDLMSDPFGNYLCQKLIEHSTDDQRLAIVRGVSPHIVAISKNMHGTRAVQKTIEFLGSGEEIRLVRDSLRGSVVALIQDLNGNHVIQKCLHKMEPNDNQFIYDAVAQHCVQVASHRHGCCVMQRCIEHASEAQKMQLVNEIRNNALALVQDAFGNYVVQYVLDLGMESVCEAIATKFLGNLYYLSTQKFSSNVVEKCLKVGNPRTIAIIARELAEFQNPNLVVGGDGNSSQDLIIQLLQHPYGNYVVQTALQEALTKAPREWHLMANRIRPFLPVLRSTPYAKRVQGLLSPPKVPSLDAPLLSGPMEEKPLVLSPPQPQQPAVTQPQAAQPQPQAQQRRQPKSDRSQAPPKSRGGRNPGNQAQSSGAANNNKQRNR